MVPKIRLAGSLPPAIGKKVSSMFIVKLPISCGKMTAGIFLMVNLPNRFNPFDKDPKSVVTIHAPAVAAKNLKNAVYNARR